MLSCMKSNLEKRRSELCEEAAGRWKENHFRLYDYYRPSLNNQKVTVAHRRLGIKFLISLTASIASCFSFHSRLCRVKWNKLNIWSNWARRRNTKWLQVIHRYVEVKFISSKWIWSKSCSWKATFLWSKVALCWFEVKCNFDVFSAFHLKIATKRATESETWMHSEKNLMIYVTILMFIYGMVAAHSYLITKRGDRKPKNIFIYVKTPNCQKYSTENLWLC